MLTEAAWISLKGLGEFSDNRLIFKGGKKQIEQGQYQFEEAHFISNRYFNSGNISTQISFHDYQVESRAGIILFYHSKTKAFTEAHIGGSALCAIQTWGPNGWIYHDRIGDPNQLFSNRIYNFDIQLNGSMIIVSIDGITTLNYNFPYTIPRGQCGIWAYGPSNIEFTNYCSITNKPKIFVVMEFSDRFDKLFSEVFLPIGTNLGFEVIRADQIQQPGQIIADIERCISEAEVIIAEISSHNPNVFWEVGYARALKKPVILVADKNTNLPFDVSSFRTIFYQDTISGKAIIEENLKNQLSSILINQERFFI